MSFLKATKDLAGTFRRFGIQSMESCDNHAELNHVRLIRGRVWMDAGNRLARLVLEEERLRDVGHTSLPLGIVSSHEDDL